MSRAQSNYSRRPLLAKSLSPHVSEVEAPRSATLAGHLADVRDVAHSVIDTVGERIVTDLGLEPDPWLSRLERSLLLAASLHDLGKANDRFQAMLRGDKFLGQQPVRHEAISAFLALHPDLLRLTLFPTESPVDHPEESTAVLAVLSHHVKYWPRNGEPPGVAVPGASGPIRLLCDHADFVDCGELVTGSRPSLPGMSLLPSELLSLGGDGDGLSLLLDQLEKAIRRDFGYHQPARPHLCFESPWGRLLAATKALLVGCDAAGSTVPRHDSRTAEWSARMLSETLEASDLRGLIRKRLDLPAGMKLSQHLRPFQQEVATCTKRITVAEAGCGSGKTIAAYAWGIQNATGRKLFLCYPTTGTATEGFGDYVLDTSIPGELVHSRALVDLEGLLTNTIRPGPETDEEEDIGVRITGLEPWGARVVVCTADTVLGLLQNHRRGLFSSAAILGSALVFDEVHSYDASMWDTLIQLLQWLPGLPVLLMTATLLEERRTRLIETFGDQVAFVSGPESLENLPRYRVERASEEATVRRRIVDFVRDGRRVLWVSNTVDRTLRRARAIAEAMDVEPGRPPVFVYHSRFRYEDRGDRHREMVNRFKKAEETPEGLVACTTQVAEMSLDLDAELLVTDLAPITSVIQRMGRLNRRVTRAEECKARPCVVLDVDSHRPYEREQLETARSWLDRLPSPASQQDLAAVFLEERDECHRRSPTKSARPALMELIHAGPGQLREPGYTVNFLLPEDGSRAMRDRTHITRAALPMTPGHRPFRSWDRIGYAFVLPEGEVDYDEYLGARWNAKMEARS